MSDWEDTYDIGMDGVPDDFDSVADFGDASEAGDVADALDPSDAAALGGSLADADAWIVDLDLGGLADLADVAVVAGVDDLIGEPGPDGQPRPDGEIGAGSGLFAPVLAHDLTDVPDGADRFAALAGRRLDDAELRNEIRHLRVRSPFGSTPVEEAQQL